MTRLLLLCAETVMLTLRDSPFMSNQNIKYHNTQPCHNHVIVSYWYLRLPFGTSPRKEPCRRFAQEPDCLGSSFVDGNDIGWNWQLCGNPQRIGLGAHVERLETTREVTKKLQRRRGLRVSYCQGRGPYQIVDWCSSDCHSCHVVECLCFGLYFRD